MSESLSNSVVLHSRQIGFASSVKGSSVATAMYARKLSKPGARVKVKTPFESIWVVLV